MREVTVLGAGLCKFGFFPQRSMLEMGEEAIWNALQDAGVNAKDIQIAYCGTMGWDRSRPMLIGHQLLRTVGITGIPITRVENVCASSAAAFREAWIAITSGLYDIALAFGVDKTTSPVTESAHGWRRGLQEAEEDEASRGLFPAVIADLVLRTYLKYPEVKREHIAMVAVQNRFHASMNPYACFQKPITVEDVLNSRQIAGLVNMLDLCVSPDGCAAVVLASGEVARRYTSKPVQVAASSHATGTYEDDAPPFITDPPQRALKLALEMAGIGIEDIDVAEIHCPMDVQELIAYEDFGLCGRGEGGKFIESGATRLGGRLPVNTSGGSLSRGHPFGATGCAQIAEILWQLRGQAGKRQVQGAKVGLTAIQGGAYEGDMGNYLVHIFKR